MILVYFLYTVFVESGDNFTDELCHQSVIARGISPDALESSIPLKCATKKICFTTSSNGECSQFAGESNVRTIQLQGNPDQMAQRIMKESAYAMYSCWSTMGEGKIDIFGRLGTVYGVDSTVSTCVVCSRLALAEDVSEETISKVKLDDYLAKTQVPGQSQTFLQKFTNDPTLQSFPVTEGYESTLQKISDSQATQDSRQVAFVFMQIKPYTFPDVAKTLGSTGTAVVAGSSFAVPGAKKLFTSLVLTPQGLFGLGVLAVGTAGVAYWNTFVGQQAAAGYCGAFVSAPGDAKKGCSIVQGMAYNVKDVNALCESIQGNP